MLSLLSFCCSVLSCLSFSSLYTSADLNTYSTDFYLSLFKQSSSLLSPLAALYSAGQFGHSAILCAHVCAYLHSQTVSIGHGHAAQD